MFTNHWWIYYGFGQIYNDGTVLRGLGQAWSLCIEITFYVALPFYAALDGAGAAPPQRPPAGADRAGAAGAHLRGLVGLPAVPAHGPAVQLVGQHAAGVRRLVRLRDGAGDHQRRPAARGPDGRRGRSRSSGAGRCSRGRPRCSSTWSRPTSCRARTSSSCSGPGRCTSRPARTSCCTSCSSFVGAGLLIPAVVGADGGGVVRRILADKRLAWLGLISYGIYLWQGSVMQVICQPQGYGVRQRQLPDARRRAAAAHPLPVADGDTVCRSPSPARPPATTSSSGRCCA